MLSTVHIKTRRILNVLCYKIFLVQAEPVYWKTHHLFGQKRINMQSAYIIFKMFLSD